MTAKTPTLIAGSISLDWLFDTHLKHKRQFAGLCKSAVIYGNEDCPDKVDLYAKRMPRFADIPVARFDYDSDSGILVQAIS